MKKCRLRFAKQDYDDIMSHLFPGDGDEHAAILLAGVFYDENDHIVLCIKDVSLAVDGVDYVPGEHGYRALRPKFIHQHITRARDEKLAYLAVHNHASDLRVGFSDIDMASHERGYPALLQIASGMPVGALVFGKRSIQADVWLPNGTRVDLDAAIVIGNNIEILRPRPRDVIGGISDVYDRQIRMFGKSGQALIHDCKVAIVGLGGIGSMIAEYLARLGVGAFVLIDDDVVEESNLSRIVGATTDDASNRVYKVDVSKRVILQANRSAKIKLIRDDVAKYFVAKNLIDCDYVFLAADSMRARLVFNAIVHQYFVPGVQVGSKIRSSNSGEIIDIMCANRPIRPGQGCLWCNQLIDPYQLALEAKTDEERKAEAYGVQEPNPSVITLNSISASHAVNDFLLNYLCLRPMSAPLYFEHFNLLTGRQVLVSPRKDKTCSECSGAHGRYGRADARDLPCLEG